MRWGIQDQQTPSPSRRSPSSHWLFQLPLNTLLDTRGVHTDLGDAVHHSGGDLSNASPAFAIVTMTVGSQKGVWLGHFAEDGLQPTPVDLAVFGLDSHGNEEDKTDDLHADNR